MAEELSSAIAWRLADTLRGSGDGTRQDETGVATFVGTDEDGVAWVRILGNDFDTPVDGGLYADAREGDSVSYSIHGGQMSVNGNATTPSVGGVYVIEVVSPVKQQADAAYHEAERARDAADTAEAEAERAHSAADDAQTSADAAQRSANNAQSSATNANEYASRALGNLSTVQSVAETLAWITQHGTMTLTSDVTPDPTHVYFVVNANGDYTVGSTRYSVVTEPDADDMATYYELSIDESLNNYVGTHLSVTNEGLWVIPTASGGYKMLIATGSGSTYTTAGTYVIDGTGASVAYFGTTSRIGRKPTADSVAMYQDAGGVTIRAVNNNVMESIIGMYAYGESVTQSLPDPVGEWTATLDYTPAFASPVTVYDLNYQSRKVIEAEFIAGTPGSVQIVKAIGDVGTLSYDGSTTLWYSDSGDSVSVYSWHVLYYKSGDRNYPTLHVGKIGNLNQRGRNTASVGEGLFALSDNQLVIGKHNNPDYSGNYPFIIGNGQHALVSSNAFTVDWSGNIVAAGKATLTGAIEAASAYFSDNAYIKSPNVAANTTYDSPVVSKGVILRNAANDAIGTIRIQCDSGSKRNRGVVIVAENEAASGVHNSLALKVDKDGNRKVQVSEVAPWHDMLYITPSEVTATVGAAASSIGTNSVRRSGKVVTVTLANIQLASAISNGSYSGTIATIPSGYRPSASVYCSCYAAGANLGGSYARITTAGIVAIRNQSGSSIAASSSVLPVISITYIIN